MNIEYCHDLIEFTNVISMSVWCFREPQYKRITKRTLHVHSNRNGLLKARQSSTVFPLAPYCSSIHSLAYDILQTEAEEKWFVWIRFTNKQLKDSCSLLFIFFNDLFFFFFICGKQCVPTSIQTKSSHDDDDDITCIEQARVGKIQILKYLTMYKKKKENSQAHKCPSCFLKNRLLFFLFEILVLWNMKQMSSEQSYRLQNLSKLSKPSKLDRTYK